MKVDRSFYKTLAVLSLPLALQSLISFGVGFADNIMVGSLGDLALSGVFISNQIQWILVMLCTGLGAAMVILAAQYVGKGDIQRAKVVVSITIKIAFSIGALLTITAQLFPAQILGIFSRDPLVLAQGLRYFPVVSLSYIFFCLNSVMTASMRCAQNTRIGFYSTLTGFFINLILNWLLIFGHMGFPALGVMGAAIATLAARICEFTITLLYIRLKDKVFSFRLADMFYWDKVLLGDFFRYGSPVILGDILWGLGGAVQAVILGRLGAEVIAANTIAANLHHVFAIIIFGNAGASGIIIGRTVGSGDVDLVKTYARALQKVFLVFGFASGILLFLTKDLILAQAFREISPEAFRYSSQFMTVFAITIVGTSYQMSTNTGIVRAGGDTTFVLLNDLFWVWVIVIPSALLSAFVFNFPPVVVFACLKCDQVFKCAVAVIKVNRWNWMKKLTR